MKITRRQLRRLINEAILRESIDNINFAGKVYDLNDKEKNNPKLPLILKAAEEVSKALKKMHQYKYILLPGSMLRGGYTLDAKPVDMNKIPGLNSDVFFDLTIVFDLVWV